MTLKVGMTPLPFTEIREGRFGSNHGWFCFSFEDWDKTITLEREGNAYQAVVLGVEDPEGMKAAILGRCGSPGNTPTP